MFSMIGNRTARPDALTQYLESPPLTTIEDPLRYWDLIIKSSNDPLGGLCALARMALDFLSAPGACTRVDNVHLN